MKQESLHAAALAPVRLAPLHYLPGTAYWTALATADTWVLDVHAHYPKQTRRNRCYVRGPHQVELLTVPVRKGRALPLREVQLDASQSWARHHARTLQTTYGKSPYFEFYADELLSLLDRPWRFLYDLNWAMLTFCQQALGLSVRVAETTCWHDPKDMFADWSDIRTTLDQSTLPAWFCPVPYRQVFGERFVPDLSILDLLCCTGPRATEILLAGYSPGPRTDRVAPCAYEQLPGGVR